MPRTLAVAEPGSLTLDWGSCYFNNYVITITNNLTHQRLFEINLQIMYKITMW